jgi:hypothetical protein
MKEVTALLEAVQASKQMLLQLPIPGQPLTEALRVVKSERAQLPGFHSRLVANQDKLAALAGYGVPLPPSTFSLDTKSNPCGQAAMCPTLHKCLDRLTKEMNIPNDRKKEFT